ncbi:DUF488 family protein [Thiorhodococcus minor]|uniref:DUF488 domain-containing protein n=1 Tax=Thiorhodococcus minor TaxID=57489 RepID=A0A6M0K592_9GAMM|nr:DUF488 domain-containing protein [Thiorhodococcus minor]NEV63525.1 DUF488 domain-containing protein [Thiorhodococcus minor]
MSSTLYTIGHSDHALEAFIGLLRQHGLSAIADVRSHPYSRRHPQFNREPLKAALREAGISYVFLGRECGARSEDPDCYAEGRVQYERLAQTALFREGLERIRVGADSYTLALMCAERDPLSCHRTLLVGRALVAQGMAVQHILADGGLESHAMAMQRLRAQLGFAHPDLFSSDAELEALAYRQQEARIAYAPSDKSSTDDAGEEGA